MKTVDVYVSDYGPKLLTDMTCEELIAAVKEQGEEVRALRKRLRKYEPLVCPGCGCPRC